MDKKTKHISEIAKNLIAELQRFLEAIEVSPPEVGSERCLNCREIKPIRTRGLCQQCYQRIFQRIRRGTLTEEKAIELGIWAAEKKPGGAIPEVRGKLDEYLDGTSKAEQDDPKKLAEILKEKTQKRAKKP